ncbi:MAG: NAD(P)H-hydrate dehydratase [Deltaproteobacteria bacterium]|nr:NAD(P)H-hydrate dehydratase [Deltaproteobacteria bacterium]
MKVAGVNEMRAMDQSAVKEFGIADLLLMENAGTACAFVLHNEVGIRDKHFVVVCGVGNNGGDGFVIARKILSYGGRVEVFVLGDLDNFKGSAKTNLEILKRLPIDIRSVGSIKALREGISRSAAVVDAIFGTGLAREVGGRHREVIELINGCAKPVLSVDIPSGVNGDTGLVMGVAVKADYTVTFGLPKYGNLLYPGYDLGGKLFVSHISFPPALYDNDSLQVEISGPPVLPRRERDGHKGSFGNALFIAGSANYLGAPYFAALSFLKSGGGYSRLAAPRSITPFIASKGSEIVFIPQPETSSGAIAYASLQPLIALSEKMDIVVVGPGISLEQETQRLTRELARRINKPLLIDGDGITAICGDLSVLENRKAPTVLTPHLGEMSRLTNRGVPELEKTKIEALQNTASKTRSIIVLKGAHSLIGEPEGRISINLSGNAGMATAGSGDVLTGSIAAMFGLGLSIEEAVRAGVFVHGFSGDLAAQKLGEDGISAQDILDHLPLATKMLRENYQQVARQRYRGAYLI